MHVLQDERSTYRRYVRILRSVNPWALSTSMGNSRDNNVSMYIVLRSVLYKTHSFIERIQRCGKITMSKQFEIILT